MKKQSITWSLLIIFCIAMLTGCGKGKSMDVNADSSFINVLELSIPNDISVVGLGEATHGNHQFYDLKREVFKTLIDKYQFKVFALEGDFGGCSVVNEFIVHDKGTVYDAVQAIGFDVYKMQEMVDLIQWMHDYNKDKSEGEKIRFYGYDMQRYDANKKGFFNYLEKVDGSKVAQYKTSLSDLNDDTIFDQAPEKVKSGLEAIESIMGELEKNKEDYIKKSSQQEYDFAMQYALCIKQNATIRGTKVPYAATRDQYMAEKVQWILEQEKNMGNGKIFLSGHNGHIEKSSTTVGIQKCMGGHLRDKLGQAYYAIGTEFYDNTFLSRDSSSDERKEFTIKNNSKLNKIFLHSQKDVALLDVKSNLKNESLSNLLTTKQPMGNVGDEFNEGYKLVKSMYTLNMVPQKAYDAIIFVKSATPTKQLKDN